MTPPIQPPSDGNPFATRWIRPGSLPYLFSPPDGATALVARLRQQHWRGQVVGPHGSGKSTLLHALGPALQHAGRRVEHYRLREGQKQLNVAPGAARRWDAATQVVVDGYEQLGWRSRLWLKWACRRRRAGLLVTAHRCVGLPLLISLAPSLEAAQAIVSRLLPAGSQIISHEDVARCFAEQRGNIREMLFALYDLYEERRPSAMGRKQEVEES